MTHDLTPEQEFFLTQYRQHSPVDREGIALDLFTRNLKMTEYMQKQQTRLDQSRHELGKAQAIIGYMEQQIAELTAELTHYRTSIADQASTAKVRLPKEEFNI